MSEGMLTEADARALDDCLARGGVAVFPTDTVYGLACAPDSASAISRLYELKGRPAAKPAAVMWFSLDAAKSELERLSPCTQMAALALLPGPVTLLLPNPDRRFPLACEPRGRRTELAGSTDPDGNDGEPPTSLGLRVPAWPASLAALGQVAHPALQSSANLSGDSSPQALSQVPKSIREGSDLVLDGGEQRGIASTVIDLTGFETTGSWSVVRQGALSEAAVARLLNGAPRQVDSLP